MLHDVLWTSNSDLARSCLAHPSVRVLGDGTLKADLFRDYIAQDAFFLRAFAEVYRLALARSSDLAVIDCFSELTAGVKEELKLHRVYAAELGIDLARVAPNSACRTYTEFLVQTAQHSSLAETVAALSPCMFLYAFFRLPSNRPLLVEACPATATSAVAARGQYGYLEGLGPSSSIRRSQMAPSRV